jgi:hypothetical protein
MEPISRPRAWFSFNHLTTEYKARMCKQATPSHNNTYLIKKFYTGIGLILHFWSNKSLLLKKKGTVRRNWIKSHIKEYQAAANIDENYYVHFLIFVP